MSKAEIDQLVYKPSTLAERWGCDVRRVYRLMRSGEIPVSVIAKKHMVVPARYVEAIEADGLVVERARITPHYVYFIGPLRTRTAFLMCKPLVQRDHDIKIGISDDPDKRLKSIQTGSAEKLGIWAFMEFESRDAALEAEGVLHSTFQRARRSGEWFRLTRELSDFIYKHAILEEIKEVSLQ